jgi:preprotein translocase subunit SecE
VNQMVAFTKISGFLNEVKTELGKVSWSTRQELIGSTSVVIVFTSIIALFIFAVDSALAKCLSIIFKA